MRDYTRLVVLIAIACTAFMAYAGCRKVSTDGDADSDADADSDSDSDSDSDADSDADADSDSDADADSDADGGCSNTDEVCSEASPCCSPDTHTCAGGTGEDPRCYANCTPSDCTYGTEAGTCIDAGGVGLCLPAGRAPAISDCTADPCTTEYGAATGVCASDGTNSYCLEECALVPSGCDGMHTCVPLTDGGGVCIPNT